MRRLRAHHLICMHQFQGMGYNEEFTINMMAVIEELKQDTSQMVTVLESMDDICAKCPNKLSEDICALSTPEKKSSNKDGRVLASLGLTDGESYPLSSILTKIDENIEEIYEVCCKGCGWEKQGVCSVECLKNGLANRFL